MKRPSFQFYPGDWLRDTALRSVSASARGAWIDMICLMHEGEPYGHLKVGSKVILPENLARMIGATLPEVEGYIRELEETGIFSRDATGCIFSRRMVNDENLRKIRAAGGVLGGNPALKKGAEKVGGKVNQKPTPSSSSSSSINTPLPPEGEVSGGGSGVPKTAHRRRTASELPDGWDEFWELYPKKVGKKDAESAWKRLAPGVDLRKAILADVTRRAASHDWKNKGGQHFLNPATYLNGERWKDQGVTLSGAAGQAGAIGGREALQRERAGIISKLLVNRSTPERTRLVEIEAALKERTP